MNGVHKASSGTWALEHRVLLLSLSIVMHMIVCVCAVWRGWCVLYARQRYARNGTIPVTQSIICNYSMHLYVVKWTLEQNALEPNDSNKKKKKKQNREFISTKCCNDNRFPFRSTFAELFFVLVVIIHLFFLLSILSMWVGHNTHVLWIVNV